MDDDPPMIADVVNRLIDGYFVVVISGIDSVMTEIGKKCLG